MAAVAGIAAGLHTLVRLPATGPGEEAVLAAAGGHGLAVGALGSYWHAPGDHQQGIVVGFGTPAEGSYPAALDVLGAVLRAVG